MIVSGACAMIWRDLRGFSEALSIVTWCYTCFLHSSSCSQPTPRLPEMFPAHTRGRRVWLRSPPASQPCRHTQSAAGEQMPLSGKSRLPHPCNHCTAALGLFCSCFPRPPCQGPQLCSLLHCCSRCGCPLWNACLGVRGCWALQEWWQRLSPPLTIILSQLGMLRVLLDLPLWEWELISHSLVVFSVAQSCPTLCDPMGCSLPRLLCPRNSPDKNTGVGCHFLLQGLNLRILYLLYWQVDSLPAEPPGKPNQLSIWTQTQPKASGGRNTPAVTTTLPTPLTSDSGSHFLLNR